MSAKPSFLAELRRRNVLRAGVLYIGAVWALAQGISQLGPSIGLPEWSTRWFLVAGVVGFPFWLVFSWLYELTPQGFRRESEVPLDASVTRTTGRKLDFAIIGVLAVAVVLLLTNQIVRQSGAGNSSTPAEAAGKTSVVSDRSIAVLPFENLSDDKNNAYFAEGIQDEILTRLAKIGALKVISRTSTARFASNPANLPEIARQLGVAHILEGSVQKAGEAVHINVQLIRAATDDHLWAEVYNRRLDDIFGVEGEVAGAIAEALNAKLTGAEQVALAKKPTQNRDAYDAFLHGRSLGLAGYDYETSRRVVAAYQEAVRLDPGFGLAWLEIARRAGYLYFNGVDPDVYTAAMVKQATDRTSELLPQTAEAEFARGNYLYRVAHDFAGAELAIAEALRRAPNDHDTLQFLGLVERRRGKWGEALAHFERAAELDPLNAGLMTLIGGETYLNMRRFAEAHAWLDRALKVAPGNVLAIGYQVSAYQQEGRLDDAARLLDANAGAEVAPNLALYRVQQRLLERRYAVAVEELAPVLARADPSLDGQRPLLTLYSGIALRYSGEKKKAQQTFDELITTLASQAQFVDDNVVPATLALAYAYAGRTRAALDQARRAVALFADDGLQRPVAELALVQVQLLSGDAGAALAGLAKSLTQPAAGTTAALLRLDPTWDALRGDPRFEALTAGAVAPTSGASR